MRLGATIIIILLVILPLKGQDQEGALEGKVSFISSQNVYIKFSSTEDISVGDTIYYSSKSAYYPAYTVSSKSSISCVCKLVGDHVPVTGEQVFFFRKGNNKAAEELAELTDSVVAPEVSIDEEVEAEKQESSSSKYKAGTSGKLSARSYSGFSKQYGNNFTRLRYIASFKAEHIANSRFSAESYIAFNHRINEWSEIQENVFNGLKIYNLNMACDITATTRATLGRKINRNITNIGAIDGLQVDQRIGNFTVGAIAGTRPDYMDYSFNKDLLQFGGYLSHTAMLNDGPMENTVAMMEQKNGALTDRRFLYFQHSNRILKDLYVFSSLEMNLFKVIDSIPQGTFNIQSFYILARYYVSEKLSLSASYDLRNNIIYYESYKNFLDQLIEDETRQGLNTTINYKAFKFVTVGLRGSYRYRKDDPLPSMNASLFLYFNRTPVRGMRATLTTNLMRTSYLSGAIYGARLSQDLVPGKLWGSINYRLFDGLYSNSDTRTIQHIGEFQVNWNIYRRLSVSASYEAMLEKQALSNTLYLNLTKRF